MVLMFQVSHFSKCKMLGQQVGLDGTGVKHLPKLRVSVNSKVSPQALTLLAPGPATLGSVNIVFRFGLNLKSGLRTQLKFAAV